MQTAKLLYVSIPGNKEHFRSLPPRDSASGLIGDYLLHSITRGKVLRLVGLANGNKGSDKDTYHVALALSCRSPPINQVKFYKSNLIL